ncbi:MAG TPA: hypothetical protein VHC69_26585 [Polyangiaceae bacterium]|nr:hypothetical protein [Polyangiaceae bacterium]
MRPLGLSFVPLLLVGWTGAARAETQSPALPGSETSPEATADTAERGPSTPLPPLGGEYRLMAGTSVGRGLRFENPYRLQTELGHDAESLSLTATYLDVSIAGLIAGGERIFHGVTVHASFALEGITQEVITPSYLLLLRPVPRWALLGRAGLPVVVEPDANVGFEIAGGGVFYVTTGLGITASLVGSLFFSAATQSSARPAIPILSMELGAVYDYEVLP